MSDYTLVKGYQEISEIAELLDDDDVTEILELVLGFIQNPTMKTLSVENYIVKIQAVCLKVGLLKTYYTTFGPKDKESKDKKNLYYTLSAELQEMVNALKYVAKG